jgi:hypothetical protein
VTTRAYFDLNVFNHLYDKASGVTEQDLNALRSAIKAEEISIPLSVHILDEMLPRSEPYTNLATKKIEFVLSLVDQQRIAKPADLLLYDDIRRYAHGQVPTDPFMGDPEISEIQSNLRSLSYPSAEEVSEQLVDAHEVWKQKEDFEIGIIQVRQQVLPKIKRPKQPKRRPPGFDRYRRDSVEQTLEDLAERAGVLDTCRGRGLGGMLDIRSVRMYVGFSISYGYAQVYEGRGPDDAAAWDLKHAVVAAATSDVFVTHDGELTTLLARGPITGFNVVTLRDLLGQTC